MFEWLTGAQDAAIINGQNPIDDETIIDAPETPAPVFAMRAMRQAIFGTPKVETPAPRAISLPDRRLEPSTKQTLQEQSKDLKSINPKPSFGNIGSRPLLECPAKGILLTPGTMSGRRKQVKFGEAVVDNEGKRKNYSRSGLPDDCPGKFPSPWTPKNGTPAQPRTTTTAKVTTVQFNSKSPFTRVPEKKVESKFTEILETTKPSKSEIQVISPPRSKDDGDLTLDLSLPRSASGRYWKDQYDSYSTRSEGETKRLIAKQKLAKDYARLKDEEAQGLRTQLDLERKKRQKREKALEIQVKDFRERLREALGENARMSAEVTSMRMRLEGQSTTPETVKLEPKAEVAKLKPFVEKSPARRAKVPMPEDIWLDEATDGEGNPRTRRLRRSPRAQRFTRTVSDEPDSQDCVNLDVVASVKKLQPARLLSRSQPSPQISPLKTRESKNTALAEKNPNKSIKPPTITLDKALTNTFLKPKSILERESISGFSHASFIHLDSSTPLEALSLQASQPTTPPVSGTPKDKRHQRARPPGSSRLQKLQAGEKRIQDAEARIAERRMKRKSRPRIKDV
ncbi:hypothetical protein BT63DRAFT_248408 [Microthyrium microscopicum]|uniref:Spindle pole body-associated protein cut12 domain-containing protein n=1 Tax=Microthyrium microscopicum TaxID=703497 RepID=A0A6A6UCD2_9PEZI|nr:hypothetical protein BT63DRAFT_248408 [Microthyrium microscopicum]